MSDAVLERAAGLAETYPEVVRAAVWWSDASLIVAVVPRTFVNAVDLREFVATELGVSDVVIALVADLPPDGLDVDEIRHMAFEVSTYVVPAPGLEQELCALWSSKLNRVRVGAGDDFLDVGGDSLIAVELQAEIFDRWGAELSLEDLFDAGTPARLVKLIADCAP